MNNKLRTHFLSVKFNILLSIMLFNCAARHTDTQQISIENHNDSSPPGTIQDAAKIEILDEGLVKHTAYPIAPTRAKNLRRTERGENVGQTKLKVQFNGLYVTGYVASSNKYFGEILKKVEGSLITGLVIDMKNAQGNVFYKTEVPLAKKIGANEIGIRDIRAFVDKLHERDLKATARLVVFRDDKLAFYGPDSKSFPYAIIDTQTMAPWKDHKGGGWTDPYSLRVQEYNLMIAEELAQIGFDQIQFDYIRFPTDGETARCFYSHWMQGQSKVDAIVKFLKEARDRLHRHNVSVAIDVFGATPWNRWDAEQWIGQNYDILSEYADVICPMFYPSHFDSTFKSEHGNQRAYWIVKEGTEIGMERGGRKGTAIQPYLQGFDYRSPNFGTGYILQQILASEEAGALGWIVWNPASKYSVTMATLEFLKYYRDRKYETSDIRELMGTGKMVD